jgi:hypothetical protein
MPTYAPEPIRFWKKALAYSFLALMLVVLVYAICSQPWILCALAGLRAFGAYSNRKHNTKLKKLADARKSEGICTFARSFDRRHVDTWIIRAVHEELQQYLKFPGGVCPVNASDKLEKDLTIDPEDIADLIPIVAQRTGRSLENTERNPYYGKITTVDDFVLFINSQPRIVA